MKAKAKAKKSILLSLIILYTFSLFFITDFSLGERNYTNNSEYSNNSIFRNKNPKISTISGKIHINNNWSAAKVAGICTGNGTYSDRY